MKKLMPFVISVVVLIMATSAWAIDAKNDPALVGLWLFDDGSGTVVADSSGNGNDGVINGDFTWDTGKFGGALIAPGAGQIDVAKSASLDTVVNAMTIAAWFRIDTDSDTGLRRPNAFLLEDQSATEMEPDGFSFRMWTSDGLSPGVYGTTQVQQGEWTHVAGTYDGTQMMLYINGVAENPLFSDANAEIDGKWGGTVGTPADALQLKFGSESLIGGMDEIILFSRALSASEIRELTDGAISTSAVNPHAKLASTWSAIKK